MWRNEIAYEQDKFDLKPKATHVDDAIWNERIDPNQSCSTGVSDGSHLREHEINNVEINKSFKDEK